MAVKKKATKKAAKKATKKVAKKATKKAAKKATKKVAKKATKKAAKKATKKVAKKATKKAAAKKATKKVAPKKATKKKVAAKKTTKKAAKKTKTKTKRKPNPAFMKAMTPSSQLAEFVGAKPLPRTEAVKKMWDYIKKHNLQDSKNRRQINANGNLEKLFGAKSITMFDLAKIINKHLS